MFDIQQYYQARSVIEAVDLLSLHPEAKLIAGGTDALVKLRDLAGKYTKLVDIHNIPELKTVEIKEHRLILGSGLTFTELVESDLVQKHLPVLAEAAATVAGPQIRNMGTLGGNVANGAVSADTAAPLLVLEPKLVIQGPEGLRTTTLDEFYLGPGQVALAHNEVLAAFEFDLQILQGLRAIYYKYAMRSAMDIATIGCAVGLKMEGERLADLRLALTVAAPTPIRCHSAEAAGREQVLNTQTMEKILTALDDDIKPRTSWRASREFRRRLIRALTERLITEAADQARGGA